MRRIALLFGSVGAIHGCHMARVVAHSVVIHEKQLLSSVPTNFVGIDYGFPVAPLIKSLKKMLRKEPKDLMEEIESFSSLVDDLRGYSW
ncbi:hypothetical protein A2U01_0027049, partial [Trifolium medium]|nr:hypothetical protein [Trifolium medium]